MSKYIELVIAIAGIILAFIPNNNYYKIIAILVAAVIIAIIRIYKVESESKKLKEEKHREIDSNLLKEIKKMLYETKRIDYMRSCDFGNPFHQNFLDPLMDYQDKSDNDPEFEFLDSNLNVLKEDLDYNISKLISVLSLNTFSFGANPILRAVPKEWREQEPERFKKVVNKANNHAARIVVIYSELVQLARKK